ncbi:hypothetical protein LN042_09820 [Kitasatospora sp. RB6PN24]|uniref:hypothetical protein n=1 Tax=Kitasatospora humi TaxID=2893891 RepID=UPI001E4DFFB4|nr:hypothetical protein [Kitasatospora humi]MCC9307394.1 hypothetical protein [Kitasatospora humi]
MTISSDAITPGDIRTRAQIQKVYGGSGQGGICPAIEERSVNLYSDPSVGEKLGYYDGWLAEEDELGPVFEYTGHGKVGDQTFEGQAGNGNRAILQHAEQDRVLRVFTRVGEVSPGGAKTHRYLGPFSLDSQQPYVWRRVHGETGRDRQVIVFRLRPDGEVQRSPEDVVPAAKKTFAELVPPQTVTVAMLHSAPATSGALSTPKPRGNKGQGARKSAAHEETSGTFVMPEEFSTRMSLRSATATTIAVRREAELTQQYKEYLESIGHQTGAFQIKVKGLTSTLRADLYDATAHVLYEVKGSSSREDVRMAIGQLYDYGRYINMPEHDGEPELAILLPAAPDLDLYPLLKRCGVGIVYRSANGDFISGGATDLS